MLGTDIPMSQEEFMRDLAIDIMARTLYGEARGEGEAGIRAVACVIVNRIRHAQKKGGFWWGHDVFSVCQKPYQFSCWNKGDPNRDVILHVTKERPVFRTCLAIAKEAVDGMLKDITMGADHYHTRAVKPSWSRDKRPCALIGSHVFFKLENA